MNAPQILNMKPGKAAGFGEQVVSVCLVVRNGGDIEASVRSAHRIAREQARYVEILVVDNHTTDGTAEKVRALQQELPDIRMVRLTRPFSREQALGAALDHSIGDLVLLARVGVDPVDLLPAALGHLQAGAQVVLRGDSPGGDVWHRVMARWFPGVVESGECIGLTRPALNALTRIRSKGRRISLEARILGYPTVTLYGGGGDGTRDEMAGPFIRRVYSRFQVMAAYSLVPLRLAALVGVLASLLSLLYLGYIVGVVVVKQKVAEGWLTTSLMHTVMSFLQFLILAVLAEYIGRILEESKDRPPYFVEEETMSTVSTVRPDRLNVAGDGAGR